MRHSLLIFAIGLTLSACGDQANNQKDTQTEAASATVVSAEQAVAGVPASESAEKSPSEQLNDWFEVNYETELMMSPISLTFLGRKERYDEIDDMSEEAEIKQLEWKRNSVAEMKERFDYEQLDANAKLSYDLWEYQYKLAEKGAKFRRSGYVFDQMRGSHSRFPTFIMGFHKVESLSDMQAYISRLSGLGRGMNQLVDRAKLGASEGVRPPRFAYEVVRQQALAVIDGVPFTESGENSPIWEDVSAKVGSLIEANTITQEQGDELLAAAKIALTEKFGPSYESLVAFLDADIENTSELSQGVHANPNGGEFYEYRLNAMTTTDMTADQIHQLGLSEVARLRTEMELLKEKSGFEGSLQEFFAYIRDSQDNEKFYFPNTDEGRKGYIDDATAAIDNIKKELPNYFGILPKGDLIVKRVESFREQDGAPQHYYPGTPDGSRPGIYYAHLSDMSAMPKNELEVIAYHEGLPGHHMQIAIAQELEGVPTFRTQAGFTAYSEGWALYSEKLAKEMPNTFSDLHSDFGRLGSEIWRAIRLVVDTGMHSKKWSEEQAVEYFSQNSPAPLETIRTEIQRYLVMPGQATSYKIGMIDIQRLRAKAEAELGEKFDIKAFHDTILGGGALPLSMLDRKVTDWIASQK
jgi:uncharacterized protein (DUF885 family)